MTSARGTGERATLRRVVSNRTYFVPDRQVQRFFWAIVRSIHKAQVGFLQSSPTMMSSFIPVRAFFGSRLIVQSRQLVTKNHNTSPYATLTSRERRRVADAARISTHLQIKREIDEKGHSLLSAFVSIPGFVRKRCKLTHRTARVKIFLEREDLGDIGSFRGRIHGWLVRLFPELEQRGLLRAPNDFDVKVGGAGLVEDSTGLKRGIERCEKSGSAVYVEVIPHNLPPPIEPLSDRVGAVAYMAKEAQEDPDHKLVMISFFKFTDIERPDMVSNRLQKVWRRMGVKGRVYVAKEGINAQLAVPKAVYADFCDAMKGSWRERGESYIPSEIVGVFLNVDRSVLQADQPFKTLHVRPREKILADGFDEPLDWDKSGEEVSPEAWHQAVLDKPDDVLLLDCRNDYESSVGRFDGAEPLNTRTFRESWEELEKRLQHVDRGRRILTYCTGGIRCVKVNAFLEQKMGFTNTGRLQGGIVSYAKQLRESGQLQDSVFKGVNHVFDGRMGETITEDLLDRCINCGQPCSSQTDCANVACPRAFDSRIFVQCEDCASRLLGACSEECHNVLEAKGPPDGAQEQTLENIETKEGFVLGECDSEDYAKAFSFDEDSLLGALRERTEREYPTRFRIMSSHIQASLLHMLALISKSQRILEIGTFTGYATLAVARALPPHGVIVTCEVDETAAAIAKEFVGLDSVHGYKVQMILGRASDYIEEHVAEGWPGFDLIFIDADKGGYESYTTHILDGNMLNLGGIMVFDNVLFRGETAKLWRKESLPSVTNHDEKPVRTTQRMQKTAMKLHNFNSYLKHEKRLKQLVLPMLDGLTIAQRTDET